MHAYHVLCSYSSQLLPLCPRLLFLAAFQELILNPSVTVELGWEVWKSKFWKFIHIILITVDVTAEKIPLGTWKDLDYAPALLLRSCRAGGLGVGSVDKSACYQSKRT